jgi:hypothetical protein
MKQADEFLTGLCNSTAKANGAQTGTLTKLATGVKTIARHVSPFVKLAIKLGQAGGLTVFSIPENRSQLRSQFLTA